MNIKRAMEEIRNCIETYLLKDSHGEYAIPSMRQRPLLLLGPPGVGKTQIMEQVARECRVGLVSYTITHHTRQSAIGLPLISEREFDGNAVPVTEYTMSEIVATVYEKMEETGLREGILFIDEINCVSETLAPAMLQFLQYKTFGNHKIPDGWIIVTAGNPPEYNKSVREFDIATLDRLKKIDVEADFAVWKEYAQQTAIHPAVLSYLEARPEHFYRIETTVVGRLFATPRGWEDLSRFLEIYEKLGKTVDRDVVYQYIEHPRIAKDFANYLELYRKYQSDYQIEKILMGTESGELIRKVGLAAFDEKFSVISLILAHLNGRFREIFLKGTYLERLLGEIKKAGGDEEKEESFSELLLGRARSLEEEIREQKKAGLLDRADDYLWRDVAERIHEYGNFLKQGHLCGKPEGIKRVQELFGAESDAYDEMSDTASSMLEHAFDFMEAAFGESQEMALFVTELNTNYYSVAFLRENHCERYFRYNKNLLFEDREDEIRKRLEKL